MRLEGQKLGGRYEVLSKVGGGGMATVYRAKDSFLNRYVAIKVLNDSLSNDTEFIRRFSREAQAAASLSHPNIVSVYDVGREDYKHYIVMELIEGPTLKEYIVEKAPVSLDHFCEIVTQICDALKHAHDNKVVHRDIKPHNIILGRNGRVKVTDFGIARAASSATITQTGSIMGSVHYFSPEQARGDTIDEKSDLYSLGVIMYEMLTGKLPFQGDTAISIALKHLQDPPLKITDVNQELPESLCNIVHKALQKSPADRYSVALDVASDIKEVIKITYPFVPDWINVACNHKTYSSDTMSIEAADLSFPMDTLASGKQSQTSEHKSIGNKTPQLDLSQNTILERTTKWINTVNTNLSWWQKGLFGIFTSLLVIVMATGGFVTLWGIITQDKGSTKVTMVKFTTVDEAREWLKSNNFQQPPQIRYLPNSTARDGAVVRQRPQPGQVVDANDTAVSLEVAGKPHVAEGEVVVNDYFKLFESRVQGQKDQAETLGYKVQIMYCNDAGSDQVAKYQVYKQEPAAGSVIKRGDTVKVYVNVPNIAQCRAKE